jgi:hypothetical protein
MENEKKSSVTIIVAIIGALALVSVPVVEKMVEIYFPPPISTPTFQSNQPSVPQPIPENGADDSSSTPIAPLIIDDLTNKKSYTFDASTFNATSSCTGAYFETGMVIVEYRITVPQSWAVIVDSWKAEWESGSYQNDGILIINGTWQGNIKINTGAICAIPSGLLQSNLQIRRNLSGNDGRPEYTIP